MFISPSMSSIDFKHARVFVPSIFIEQDPQMPSLHERLKVKLESISCLILIKASQHHWATFI